MWLAWHRFALWIFFVAAHWISAVWITDGSSLPDWQSAGSHSHFHFHFHFWELAVRRWRLLSLQFRIIIADSCVTLKQLLTQHTDIIWPSAVGLLYSWIHRISNWPSAVGLWFQTTQISHTINTDRNWPSAVGLTLTLIHFIFALIVFLHRRWWPSAVGSEYYIHWVNTDHNWPSAVGLAFLVLWHYISSTRILQAGNPRFSDLHRKQCWPSAVGLLLQGTLQYTDNSWPSAVGLHFRCGCLQFLHRIFWPSAVGLCLSGIIQHTDNSWPSAVGLHHKCGFFHFLHRIVLWPSAVGLLFSVNTGH